MQIRLMLMEGREMKKVWIIGGVAGLFLYVAYVGLNPFTKAIDPSPLLADGYTDFETGVRRLPNGTLEVAALTRMPDVRAEMVRWWFADYMQTTEHYKRWHPKDHVWMDWENKVPGEVVGASHLVHEYIGGELGKLRIQFVDPTEFFGFDPNGDDQFVICARAGLLEEALNAVRMCHLVRNTEWGAEMRSRFWLGHVAVRDGNDEVASLIGAVGNAAIVRAFALSYGDGVGLLKHAIEEMGILASFLPSLYASEAGR